MTTKTDSKYTVNNYKETQNNQKETQLSLTKNNHEYRKKQPQRHKK